MKYANYFLLLMLLLLFSCVKIVNNVIDTDSLPYSIIPEYEINPYKDLTVDMSGSEMRVTSEFDSSDKKNWIYIVECKPDSLVANDNMKAIFSGFNTKFERIYQENFNVSRFPGLLDVTYIGTEMGVNKVIDRQRIFLLKFTDRFVIQYCNVGLRTIWGDSAVYSKNDYSNIVPVCLWKPNAKGKLILVLLEKSGAESIEPVSRIIFHDLSENKLINEQKSLAVSSVLGMAPITKKLLLYSNPTNNGFEIDNMPDAYRYFIVYNDYGNLIKYVKLDNDPDNQKLSFHLSEKFIYNICYNNTSNSTKSKIIKFDYDGNPIDSIYTYKNIKSAVISTGKTSQKSFIVITSDRQICKLGQDFKDVNNSTKDYPDLQYNNFFSKVINNESAQVDLNDNDENDHLVLLNDNQLGVIDGDDLEILASIKIKEPILSAGFIHDSTNYFLLIITKGRILRCEFKDNSFLSRILIYRTEIELLFLIFVLFPTSYYLYRKLIFTVFVYNEYSRKGKTLGLVLMKNDNVYKINQLAKTMLGLKSNEKVTTQDLPSEVKTALSNKKKNESNVELIELSPNSYISLSFGREIDYWKSTYFTLSINDTTKPLLKELNKKVTNSHIENALLLSHDVKSPLWKASENLKNMMSFLEDGRIPTTDWILKNTENIRSKLTKAIDGVDIALYYNKQKLLYPKPININQVIENWINKNLIQHRDLEVRFVNEIDSRLPKVNVDEKYFHALLDNFLNNSTDEFVNKNIKGILRFSTKKSIDKFDLIIADNAGGMPKEIAEKIYNGDFITTKERGSGLGMKIIRDVCDAHSLIYSFNNKVGYGLELIITFNIGNFADEFNEQQNINS